MLQLLPASADPVLLCASGTSCCPIAALQKWIILRFVAFPGWKNNNPCEGAPSVSNLALAAVFQNGCSLQQKPRASLDRLIYWRISKNVSFYLSLMLLPPGPSSCVGGWAPVKLLRRQEMRVSKEDENTGILSGNAKYLGFESLFCVSAQIPQLGAMLVSSVTKPVVCTLQHWYWHSAFAVRFVFVWETDTMTYRH